MSDLYVGLDFGGSNKMIVVFGDLKRDIKTGDQKNENLKSILSLGDLNPEKFILLDNYFYKFFNYYLRFDGSQPTFLKDLFEKGVPNSISFNLNINLTYKEQELVLDFLKANFVSYLKRISKNPSFKQYKGNIEDFLQKNAEDSSKTSTNIKVNNIPEGLGLCYRVFKNNIYNWRKKNDFWYQILDRQLTTWPMLNDKKMDQ